MSHPSIASTQIKTLQQLISEGYSILAEELWDSPKALIATASQEICNKNILIITGQAQEESRLLQDLKYFSKVPICDFPSWETLPGEKIAPSPDVVGDRYQVLQTLCATENKQIVVSSLQACLQKLIPRSALNKLQVHLCAGQELAFTQLVEQIIEMGYTRCTVASDKGEFAVRGGIIDVYPVSSPDPVRIEFWGDEIESLRIYDPIAQTSIEKIDNVHITPGKELEFLNEQQQLETILDYLGPETIVIFDDLLAIEDRYASLKSLSNNKSQSFLEIEEFLDDVSKLTKIYFTEQTIDQLSNIQLLAWNDESSFSSSKKLYPIEFQMFKRSLNAVRWLSPFQRITDTCFIDLALEKDPSYGDFLLLALQNHLDPECHLEFLCDSDLEQQQLQKRLQELGIQLSNPSSFSKGYLSSGYYLPDISYCLLPNTEITQRHKIRRQKQRSTYHSTPSEAYELSNGDAVVHLNNGIGVFHGITKKTSTEGVTEEFFQIEYADQAQLFVPLNQSHLVSKYVGTKDSRPNLHKLGSSKWKRAKASTEKAIMGYASDLLKLSAERELKGGIQYASDSELLQQFEQSFPFVETEDQIAAIQDIKKDMCSTLCMNRLVCGDVGFGKTEVAMRAAFKAVVDGGMQVAVLVPTTVLAMQHYETFKERMKHFPVQVEVLSRFRKPKETKLALEKTASGSVDILIGTHRLLSKDVYFKNLGLVIIDEEQRFGVRSKEHLKKVRSNVDCLTLSATPIPRTLYMSLVGARDMSVICTPPQERLPIKSILTESSDAIIRQAILRELNRDGQVFVIHNRVESIDHFANKIQQLVPQAKVVVAHGQMASNNIDSIFHQFKEGEADILVATTIVENGIDIPNANTILIDQADCFGLSELYQLRGRVGRWNKRAYAYLLTRKGKLIAVDSKKRLDALLEASGFGAGFKLAMRDLEIRGAGNILGVEQSGHVSSIGFHLYCKLLKRTIATLKGQLPSCLTDTRIEFPITAHIPESYISESSLRMSIYQRLGEAVSWEEVKQVGVELKDRFGPPPKSIIWLYHLTRIKVFGSRNGFTLIKWSSGTLIMERKLGKDSASAKVPLKPTKKPKELEDLVIHHCKKQFKIK